MKCSYCGYEAEEIILPDETFEFRGQIVTTTGIKCRHCLNTNCPEPDWISAKEGIKEENQIREQLGVPLLEIPCGNLR